MNAQAPRHSDHGCRTKQSAVEASSCQLKLCGRQQQKCRRRTASMHDRHVNVVFRTVIAVAVATIAVNNVTSIGIVHGQTTAYVGYPDPRYSDTKNISQFSCIGGLPNCPDGGEYAAAGGNLTVTILAMRNLPDLDGFGLAGLQTDAYIEVCIGDNVRRSGTILNSLNPVWPPCLEKGCRGANDTVRDLNFGFRPAGTEIVIKVWDEDSGFEFGDDLIQQVTVNAIYCSAFTARVQALPNAEDSAWHMPEQPLCVEQMWLPLVANSVCEVDGIASPEVPCILIRMTALPFQIAVEETFLTGAIINGGMGGYFPDEDSWLYGRVYSSSITQMASYFRMTRSKGGLLIRSDSTLQNNKGNTSLVPTYPYAPVARVTFNFDAELFVFRLVADAPSAPEWLAESDQYGWVETLEYAQLVGFDGDFQAVAQNFTAHTKNEYGDAFKQGVITGANVAQDYKDTVGRMYFIVAQPHESFDVVAAVYSKDFGRAAFANISLQFAPNVIFLMVLVVKYLKRMNWRIERVQSFLAEKVVIVDKEDSSDHSTTAGKGSKTTKPKGKSATQSKSTASPASALNQHASTDIVAALFLCYKESPRNLEFRRNLWYATFAIKLIIVAPVLFIMSWGVTAILLVTPPAFGFGLIFLGLGAVASIYAVLRWIQMGWRMTSTILAIFVFTFFSSFAFLFSAIFADLSVFVGGENVDFFSLSCIFLTFNMMPMLWIAFTNDAKLSKSLTQVMAVVSANKKVNVLKTRFKNLGTLGLKLAAAKGGGEPSQTGTGKVGAGGEKRHRLGSVSVRARKESVFAPIMGDHYSVEPSIPGFSRADILQNAFVTAPETKARTNRRCYLYALVILAVYCVVAYVRTTYPAQSIGISVTVVLVDACIYMLYRGSVSWSAGYTVFLMSCVRVCLAATSGDYWILGHAFLYMIFGTALCREIIGKNLPRMNAREAGGVTFFGHDHMQALRHLDMSTTPEFVLGFLSFFYVFLLLAVAFGTDANQTIQVPVMGQEWPLWIFGVLAFIVVLFTGLALATSRAFFLQREQLLSDYAQQVYLFVRAWKLPFMLAAASEVLVVCSGLFVYASTKSTFILVTSFFGPLLLMLSLAVYVQWRRNDYRLVIWPPEEDEEDILDEDDDDELDEVAALEREAELMREAFVLPPLKGKKSNTSFFDGNDETFKMPSLPPKSALPAKFLQKGSKPEATHKETSATPGGPSFLNRVGLKGHTTRLNTEAKANRGPSVARGGSNRSSKKSLTFFPPNGNTGLEQVLENGSSRMLNGTATRQSSKPSKLKALYSMLRDVRAGRVRFRDVFARRTWHKYRDGSARPDNINGIALSHAASGSGEGLSPPGSTRALLGGNSAIDVNFATMSLYQAYQQGFLLPQDYVTLGCFGALLVLLLVYGIILSLTEHPAWLGHLIWVGVYVAIFSLFPTVKYFKIAGVTQDMTLSFAASYLLAWITGFILFFAVMHANVNDVESLVILSILVFYPIFLLFIVTLFKWKDEGWALTRPVKRIFTFSMASITLWIFEMYVFASVFIGALLTFLMALFLFLTFFLVKYVENDMYLAPVYQRRANRVVMVATALAIFIGVLSGLAFFFCLSIAFVVLILKYALHVGTLWLMHSGGDDMALFFSPYVFPVFSYNAYTNNVVDENRNVRHIYMIFLLCFLWGACGVMFFNPLGFGIGLCSLVLLSFAGLTAHLCAITPVRMGIAAKYINEMILKDASTAAKDATEQRRTPFTLESAEFIEIERREKKTELEFQAIAYGGAAARNKKATASGSGSDTLPGTDVAGDHSHCALPPRRSGGEIALEIDMLERSCRFQSMADGGDDEPLRDGLYTWRDVFRDAFHAGTGPFGFLYVCTIPWRVYRYLRWRYFPSTIDRALEAERLARANEEREQQQAEEDDFHAIEMGIKTAAKDDMTDLVGILMELPVLDEELDKAFYEETRCIIHLQLLMMNAADARLSREKILFQKFLRENRFKLMSNGINPPANIFKTSSFASIDIPLVAVWLISLTEEERTRFHALKAAFNEEMERLDAIIDAEDTQSRQEQQQFRASWRDHEEAQCRRRQQEFMSRRLRREAEGISAEEELAQDEALVNAQETMMEIESGYSCIPGECGRALQFVDRDFPPDETSVASVACASELAPTWKVSTAINVVAGLFDGGTDPDDVNVGRLNDSWLLSAISIIAASGGVDDGKVDALIDQIFITKQTSLTGAYALRLFHNCQWETVVVDDFFPVLADDTTSTATAAFAHSHDFEELWVPLLEKAVAKYYGGYAALEQGYVHHALKMLTSYDSEEISLAQASRGTLKQTLWKQLLTFRGNRFLMGAGTITSTNADTEILDTGLVFGACYVVYDVREVDGHRLLQLRNPPGDHDEWKGDWSDHSRLWTRRLKKLLHWSADGDGDNTFWMSFDDFCHAFRSLYVCRYYDPVKWPRIVRHGQWVAGATACGLPTRHNPECALDGNPQYTLSVTRPTEVMLTLTQVDAAGLAPVDVLPVAVYIVAQGARGDRAYRVKTLTREVVVAHSGEPVRQREVHVRCELAARAYTVLVAAYKRGMEGPFKLTVQTNYPVVMEQLWPALWKAPLGTGDHATMAEKMAARVLETVNESAAMSRLKETKHELAAKLAAGAAVVDSALRDDEAVLREELAREEEQQHQKQSKPGDGQRKTAKMEAGGGAGGASANHWLEQWDEDVGKPFYYNKQTGESKWEKPAEF